MGEHSVAYIAVDTSKLRNSVAIAEAGQEGGICCLGEIDTTAAATAKLVRKLAGKYGELTFCYVDEGHKSNLLPGHARAARQGGCFLGSSPRAVTIPARNNERHDAGGYDAIIRFIQPRVGRQDGGQRAMTVGPMPRVGRRGSRLNREWIPTDMTLRLGTNPIAWSNDDLRELGGATPLETCLAEARQAGFAGIELGHKFPRTAPELRAVLGKYDLALVSGWYSASLLTRDAVAEMAAMRPHLDLLKALGCTVLILAETSNAVHGDRSVPLSRRPALAAAAWPRFGERLTALAAMTAAEGVAIAYHHHMGTVVQSRDDIEQLMTVTGPELKLLLDTGHATFGSADPVALARRWHDRIGHVHCKDVRPDVMRQARDADWSFLDAVVAGVFTVPGDGTVDFPAVLRELPDYAGWLVIEAEQDPAKANPLRYATMGRANLVQAARQAGLL